MCRLRGCRQSPEARAPAAPSEAPPEAGPRARVGRCLESRRAGGGRAPLVLLEVELGDPDGLLGRVGEADGLVGLQRGAQEPARAGGGLEAGGGAAVGADEGEALVPLLGLAQFSDVDLLEAERWAGESSWATQPSAPTRGLRPPAGRARAMRTQRRLRETPCPMLTSWFGNIWPFAPGAKTFNEHMAPSTAAQACEAELGWALCLRGGGSADGGQSIAVHLTPPLLPTEQAVALRKSPLPTGGVT